MAEIFGEEICEKRTVVPLVSVSDECMSNCSELDDEYAFACRDAVISEGEVNIVHCLKYGSECQVRRSVVGYIDNGIFHIQPGYGIDEQVSKKIAERTGRPQDEIVAEMQENNGLADLTNAVITYGFKNYI